MTSKTVEAAKATIPPTLLQRIDHIDKKISAYFHNIDFGLLNHIVLLFAVTFNVPFVVVIPSSYVYWKSGYQTREILHYLALQLIGVIITLILKKFFARPRPILESILGTTKTRSLRKREKNCSMPSGDSMQVALFGAFCFLNFGEARWLYIIPIVMYGRVHFMCHYFADTIVGAGIALAVAFTCNRYIQLLVQFFF